MVQVHDATRFTVLLPDEQEGWHQTVQNLLRPQGVASVLARTGQEALAIMRQSTVHCAVLDMNMPQLGGLEVVRMMRHLPSPPPALLLVQQITNHLLHEAMGMHVFSVLTKPVDFNVLLDALARVLRRYHNSRWPTDSADGMQA